MGSLSQIEEHLRNAAQLLGADKIPSKWIDVLKIMESAGTPLLSITKCAYLPHIHFNLKARNIIPCALSIQRIGKNV